MTAPWSISPVDLHAVRSVAAGLGVSRVTAEILVRRGHTDAARAGQFLAPPFVVSNPLRSATVAAAAKRLDAALRHGHGIVVHGDYDADGITAAFVLASTLEELGGQVRVRLPHRFRDGYGLSMAAVEEAAEANARLLVTVDCGTRDGAAVQRALDLGIDVLVTDHHALGPELPPCHVVSPQVDTALCSGLAGVGVAFKLAHALLETSSQDAVEVPLALRKYLDVVALGTVADVVPLVDENRVLVQMGLARLATSPQPGLQALLEITGSSGDAVSSETLSFRLAPRINAAGRLGDAGLALELLRAADRSSALPLAQRLDACNAERQQIERSILEQALERVPEPVPAALVLDDADWHEGVLGIVANRIAERVGRPVVLLRSGADVAKGSGRSIAGFDLLAAVTACAEPLLTFGGHAAACGVRLPRESISRFRDLFTAYAAAHLTARDLARPVQVDAVVAGDELTLALAEELERLAPHGAGNPRVTLLVHDAVVEQPRRTRDGRHLRCRVRADGVCASAVHFDFPDETPLEGRRFDVPLELTRDRFNGVVRAQARVRALLPVGEAAHDLCATACAGACPHRLQQTDLLAALDSWPSPLEWPGEGVGEPVAQVVDQRGRPVISTLSSLVAAGGCTLVLVADVARRRPLLTRDLPLAALGADAAYLSAACLMARRDEVLAMDGTCVVMLSCETLAAFPGLAKGARRLVVVDPPFSQAAYDAVRRAAGSRTVVTLWGASEVGFAGRVLAGEYDLDRRLRSLWRALQRSVSLQEAVAAEFTGAELLSKPPVLAAALRTLRDVGLLHGGVGKNLESKVDLSTSPTYRAWLRLYRHDRFLDRCQNTKL